MKEKDLEKDPLDHPDQDEDSRRLAKERTLSEQNLLDAPAVQDSRATFKDRPVRIPIRRRSTSIGF